MVRVHFGPPIQKVCGGKASGFAAEEEKQLKDMAFSAQAGNGMEEIALTRWGFSSVGRAPALQAGGQRFEPANLHQERKAKAD